MNQESLSSKNSVLDALLRGKSPFAQNSQQFDARTPPHQTSDLMGTNPWSVSSRLMSLSKHLGKTDEAENKSDDATPPNTMASYPDIRPMAGIPSVPVFQNQLAGALNKQLTSPVDPTEQEYQQPKEQTNESVQNDKSDMLSRLPPVMFRSSLPGDVTPDVRESIECERPTDVVETTCV